MTMLMDRVNTWDTHPGWGIAVDLTPGEVVNARRVSGLKKLIVALVLLVLLIVAGVTFLALQDEWAAQDAYNSAEAETADLQAEAREYADITLMETTISSVDSQLAVLMADDVNYVNLMAKVRARLPAGLVITNMSILLAQAPEVPVDPNAPPAVGPQVIGSLTISGKGTGLRALPPFVKELSKLRGVVDVVPTSSSETEAGMQYTLSMNITDELYTHRFDQGGAS